MKLVQQTYYIYLNSLPIDWDIQQNRLNILATQIYLKHLQDMKEMIKQELYDLIKNFTEWWGAT